MWLVQRLRPPAAGAVRRVRRPADAPGRAALVGLRRDASGGLRRCTRHMTQQTRALARSTVPANSDATTGPGVPRWGAMTTAPDRDLLDDDTAVLTADPQSSPDRLHAAPSGDRDGFDDTTGSYALEERSALRRVA